MDTNEQERYARSIIERTLPKLILLLYLVLLIAPIAIPVVCLFVISVNLVERLIGSRIVSILMSFVICTITTLTMARFGTDLIGRIFSRFFVLPVEGKCPICQARSLTMFECWTDGGTSSVVCRECGEQFENCGEYWKRIPFDRRKK